jgi:hypothetical protein
MVVLVQDPHLVIGKFDESIRITSARFPDDFASFNRPNLGIGVVKLFLLRTDVSTE